MKVISLFDGISTGQYCLKQLGIDVEKYYASEIDKYAIAITQHNFPNTIQMGDVNKWREWDIDWSTIDLIIGGSPCQNLSNAGNGTGLEGSESSLFFRYLEILNHIKSLNPNVKF
jgi:DNA (cytosine-5)-methyltransferase 3A